MGPEKPGPSVRESYLSFLLKRRRLNTDVAAITTTVAGTRSQYLSNLRFLVSPDALLALRVFSSFTGFAMRNFILSQNGRQKTCSKVPVDS